MLWIYKGDELWYAADALAEFELICVRQIESIIMELMNIHL